MKEVSDAVTALSLIARDDPKGVLAVLECMESKMKLSKSDKTRVQKEIGKIMWLYKETRLD